MNLGTSPLPNDVLGGAMLPNSLRGGADGVLLRRKRCPRRHQVRMLRHDRLHRWRLLRDVCPTTEALTEVRLFECERCGHHTVIEMVGA